MGGIDVMGGVDLMKQKIYDGCKGTWLILAHY